MCTSLVIDCSMTSLARDGCWGETKRLLTLSIPRYDGQVGRGPPESVARARSHTRRNWVHDFGERNELRDQEFVGVALAFVATESPVLHLRKINFVGLLIHPPM
jgi:hypothetical protein